MTRVSTAVGMLFENMDNLERLICARTVPIYLLLTWDLGRIKVLFIFMRMFIFQECVCFFFVLFFKNKYTIFFLTYPDLTLRNRIPSCATTRTV